MIITVDGPSGAGKGTIARLLADYYGYNYVDTGLFFRQVAYLLVQQKGSARKEKDVLHAFECLGQGTQISPSSLRTEEISQIASIISTFPSLREGFVSMNREFAQTHENVIFDGRDMGTIVFPTANKKIFLKASAEIRASRRQKDLESQGIEESFENILKSIEERDLRDASRSIAPTKPAPDAFVLDTTYSSVEEVFRECVSFIEK